MAPETEFVATAHCIRDIPVRADRRCRARVDAVRGRAGFAGRDPAQGAAASGLAVHGAGVDVAEFGGLDPVAEAVDGVGAAEFFEVGVGAAWVDEGRSVSTYRGRERFFLSFLTHKIDDGEGKRGVLFFQQMYVH